MGEYANTIQALAALANVGTSAYGMATAPGPPGMPKAPGMPDYSQIARANLPTQKANAAATLGGGLSPEFLAGLVGQESGSAQGGLDILNEIRRSLGPGQSP